MVTHDNTLVVRTTRTHAGRRLDAVLAEWLSARLGTTPSRSAVRRLIMAGAVRVDGRVVRRPGLPLRAYQRLDAHLRPAAFPATPAAFVLTPAHVLYEDAAVIAVDKPPGLPTHVTADPRRPHLEAAVRSWLGRVAASEPYLGLHQRLDLETSGVVLFAKDPRANPGLARAFAAGEVLKTYRTLVTRPSALPPLSWTLEGRLGPIGSGRLSRIGTLDGGAPAVTDFRRLGIFPRALLLEAMPRTGRKHQIRAQLAEAGMPIWGDRRYGGPPAPFARRVLLHASRLELRHPLSGKRLRIESPEPQDFRRAVAALEREQG